MATLMVTKTKSDYLQYTIKLTNTKIIPSGNNIGKNYHRKKIYDIHCRTVAI